MPFSTFYLNQALQGLSTVTIASLYQNPARSTNALAGATTGVYTVTSPTFPIVTGNTVLIASGSLPAVLTGLPYVFIRPVPSTTGQFYAYSTLANAVADTNRLVPGSAFTGTVVDRDLDVLFSAAALAGYESTFTGYARSTANYATGTVPASGNISRSVALIVNNSSATSASVTHVLALASNGTDVIGIAKLANVAVVPATETLTITTSVLAAGA